VSDDYIAIEKLAQLGSLRERRAHYPPGRWPIAITHRTVIVVDDGLATGDFTQVQDAEVIARLNGEPSATAS
jgi:putative phosphoribosyl transferase